MDEYEGLVRSLLTERFTRWSPRSSNETQWESFERPLSDTASRPGPRVRAHARYGKNTPEARADT